MNCKFCNADIYIRYSIPICKPCHSGAISALSLINPPQNNQNFVGGGGGGGSDIRYVNIQNPSEVFVDCLRWIKEMKDIEEEQKDRVAYLGGFVDAFKEHLHTDVEVLPGNDGSPIPTHRALLATRSRIFKNMLNSDESQCSSNDPIALPEFSYEELESLVEFLYSGHVTDEKLEKHVYSLSNAAHKYEIPFLGKFCEEHLLKSLNSNNALEVLEFSNTFLMPRLKEVAFNFILKNMDDIVNSPKYDAFVRFNPDLSVAINKAFVNSKRNFKCFY